MEEIDDKLINIEFAVNDLSEKSLEKIRENLQKAGSIKINHEYSTIIVNTSLPWMTIKTKIENTGASASLTGFSGSLAGVAVLDKGSEEIKGVVRFGALKSGCVIDGIVDGLESSTEYTFSLMELGNVVDGCNNLGDEYTKKTLTSNSEGQLEIKLYEQLKIEDLIGRSVMIANSTNRLSCGIIARSSGVLQNFKKICACDGTKIWDGNKTKA